MPVDFDRYSDPWFTLYCAVCKASDLIDRNLCDRTKYVSATEVAEAAVKTASAVKAAIAACASNRASRSRADVSDKLDCAIAYASKHTCEPTAI